jgi:CheY-like chemotaxis protein
MDRAARLLVVDDTPQNGRLLEAMLTPHGYTVALALSGREGLAKLHSEPPDLVLLDVIMSGGAQLLEPHRREVTILFCDLRGFTAFAANASPKR